MKKNKLTLGMIISLLVIFLPLSVYSFILHKKLSIKVEDNPNKEFRYENKLYFYQDNNLLGTYECTNFLEYCDFAYTSEGKTTSLNELDSKKKKLTLVNNRFAFLMDTPTANLLDANIILYDLTFKRAISNYKEVKDYEIGIERDYYIVKNTNDLWGVMNFRDGIVNSIPFQYDFIGLVNKLGINGKINSDIFAVSKDNKWQLLEGNGEALTPLFASSIYNYNSSYVILSDDDGLSLVNLQGTLMLNDKYKFMDFYDSEKVIADYYLKVIDKNNQFYIYDLRLKKNLTTPVNVNSINEVKLEEKKGSLEVYINDKLVENVTLS